MDRTLAIFLANFALIALLWFLRSRAQKDPRKFWVLLLYGVRMGPRTDVARMTKDQLLESAVRFVTWGLIFLSAWCANAFILDAIYPNREQPHGFFLVVMFATTLLAGMGFLGGIYLLVRWLFRRKSYVPPRLP